jgi:hypothetical protein
MFWKRKGCPKCSPCAPLLKMNNQLFFSLPSKGGFSAMTSVGSLEDCPEKLDETNFGSQVSIDGSYWAMMVSPLPL